MNSLKKVQSGSTTPLGMTHYGADHSQRLSERMALVELLQQHLLNALELQRYVSSLEFRLRNVSFVDVRQLFHRIGDATEQCAAFLAERIHDLTAAPAPCELRLSGETLRNGDDLSFAACLQHIGIHTNALAFFATQTKSFMDRAVINGDYNSLHVMTDCIYQISQLVALIQIHLPAEPSTSTDSPYGMLSMK